VNCHLQVIQVTTNTTHVGDKVRYETRIQSPGSDCFDLISRFHRPQLQLGIRLLLAKKPK
jgi:hypothetical protein